LAPMYTVT